MVHAAATRRAHGVLADAQIHARMTLISSTFYWSELDNSKQGKKDLPQLPLTCSSMTCQCKTAKMH